MRPTSPYRGPPYRGERKMRRKLALVLGSAILASGLALSVSYAQDQQQNAPDQAPPSGHGMMDRGMMGNGMGGMLGNSDMMAQMSRMMENSTKIMESHMHKDHMPTHPHAKTAYT